MKYLAALQQKKLFTLQDAEQLTGNLMTAKTLLQSYKKAGYIISIRRNLYAAVDLASGEPLANRYEIGSSVNHGAFISHHSALEYHGVANQVFYTVTVSSADRFTEFEFGGITYEQYAPKIMSGVIAPPRMPLVSVTDIDQTVIDCFCITTLMALNEQLATQLPHIVQRSAWYSIIQGRSFTPTS